MRQLLQIMGLQTRVIESRSKLNIIRIKSLHENSVATTEASDNPFPEKIIVNPVI